MNPPPQAGQPNPLGLNPQTLQQLAHLIGGGNFPLANFLPTASATTTALPQNGHVTLTPSALTTQTHLAPMTAVSAAHSAQARELHWPVTAANVALTKVPHFDPAAYRTVNFDVNFSSDTNGLDLPLGDMNTLRFFFNFGLAQAKTAMLNTQGPQEHQPRPPAAVAPPQPTLLPGLAGQAQLANMLPQLGQPSSGNAQIDQLLLHGILPPGLARQAVQAQIAAQQAQLLAATAARSQALTDRAALSGLQNPELLAMAQAHAAQLAGSPAAAAAGLVRANAATSQPPSAKTSVVGEAPDQAVMLHQALLNFGSSKTPSGSLHDARITQLLNSQSQQQHQQQNGHHHHHHHVSEHTKLPVHSVVDDRMASSSAAAAAGLLLKPVAVGGGSGDAAISPRPPIPIDPTPPRPPIDAIRHQQVPVSSSLQAQTSPPSSSPSSEPSVSRLKETPIIGANRPASAREIAPSKPSISGESSDVMPHLFQYSERNFTEAFTARNAQSASQGNPIGIARPNSTKEEEPPSSANGTVEKKEEEEKPALAPILMMSFLNSCMSDMRSTLTGQGMHVTDQNGCPVDYSSRPVDRIFQQARHQRDNRSPLRLPGDAKNSPSQQTRESPPKTTTINVTDRDSDCDSPSGKRLRIADDE